jgi:hypothetical protein
MRYNTGPNKNQLNWAMAKPYYIALHKCNINVTTFGQIWPVWHVEKHGLYKIQRRIGRIFVYIVTHKRLVTKHNLSLFGNVQWPVSGNFLPFKGKSSFLCSQAAPFFSFAKGIFSHSAHIENPPNSTAKIKLTHLCLMECCCKYN